MPRNIREEQLVEDSLALKESRNRPERLDWFSRQGLGAFIHITCDVQFGTVISHNLINANADYCARYFNELPKSFCPHRFDPTEWARFFKLIGVKYVVLTNKHHNGFCLWQTETTPFSIANTPYRKDLTRILFDACREQDLAIGVYFSPDDFHVLWQQGKPICRERKVAGLLPKDNPELMALAKEQIRELFTDYGRIDTLFIDGDPTGLREWAWELQPDCVITRGALETPEQHLPEVPEGEMAPPEPWEACFTLGRQWQYRAVDEAYKSPRKLAEMLIQTRARGGSLLINFGPMPDGRMPPEQEGIMREVGHWLFVNQDGIHDVKPWRVAREGDVYFTHSPEKDTVYAHLTNIDWPSLPLYPDTEYKTGPEREAQFDADGLYKARGRRLQWRLKSVRPDAGTVVELMSQKTENAMSWGPRQTVEWEQQGDEFVITAWYYQRQHNDWYWDMPMAVRIIHPASAT